MAQRKERLTLIHNDKAGNARHCREELAGLAGRGRLRVWQAETTPEPDSVATIALRSEAEPIAFVTPR